MNVVCSKDAVKLDLSHTGILKGEAFARSKSAKVRELTFAYGFSKKNIKKQTFLTEWKKFFLQKKIKWKKEKKNISAHWDFPRE